MYVKILGMWVVLVLRIKFAPKDRKLVTLHFVVFAPIFWV